jgi:hypothetical protein
VVPLEVPASLKTCAPEPVPPAGGADDAAVADYIVAIDDAGEDCRTHLRALNSVISR